MDITRKDLLRKEFGAVYDRIQRLTLMNNALMTKVFEDQQCVEFILQIILNRKDIFVMESHVQEQITNLQGKSVILDILASDIYGNQFNVEIQRTNQGAKPERAGYHTSLLQSNMLGKGDDFYQIPDTYVIFITENDVLGDGLPIYHIERTIQENHEVFKDGSHIIYVNARITDETELGRLMHDFQCEDYHEMSYDVIKDRVKYFKDEKEGIVTMREYVEDWEIAAVEKGRKEGFEEGKLVGIQEGKLAGIQEGKLAGIEEGKSEGIEQERKNTILMLKRNGFSEEKIAEMMHISMDEVNRYVSLH